MPVSAKRLRLAGWSIIIGAVWLSMTLVSFRMITGQEDGAQVSPRVAIWAYLIGTVMPWLTMAVIWIVLTTWKRVALAAEENPVLKWTYNLLLALALTTFVSSLACVMAGLPMGPWFDLSAKIIMPLNIIAGAVLFFALRDISSEDMPLVHPLRWAIVFCLVVAIIIGLLSVGSNRLLFLTIGGDVQNLLLFIDVIFILGFIGCLSLSVLLCVMFFKLARRVEKAGRPEEQAPIPAQG